MNLDQDALFPVVYDQLHALAQRQRRRISGNYFTLNTTALVHECYAKLWKNYSGKFESRAHFFSVAAKAMQQILYNYARDQRRAKRGGHQVKVTFDEAHVVPEEVDAFLDLHEALTALEQRDAIAADVARQRFLIGLTYEEIADHYQISVSTVRRLWRKAKTFLHDQLKATPWDEL